MITEVISQPTENDDLVKKFQFYRSISTLRKHILIAQSQRHLGQFSKATDNQSILSEYVDEDPLGLTFFQLEVPLSEIYNKVDFEPKE